MNFRHSVVHCAHGITVYLINYLMVTTMNRLHSRYLKTVYGFFGDCYSVDNMAEVRESAICETLNITLNALLLQNNLRINKVPKDGLCLVHACAEALQVEREVLVNKLMIELTDNRSAYQHYFSTGCDISHELQMYLKQGKYNSDVGDMCVPAIANAIGAEIIVYQSVMNDRILKTVQSPSHPTVPTPGLLPATLHLLRSGCESLVGMPLHYDVLLPTNVERLCSSATSAKRKVNQEKNLKQVTIGSMFKKQCLTVEPSVLPARHPMPNCPTPSISSVNTPGSPMPSCQSTPATGMFKLILYLLGIIKSNRGVPFVLNKMIYALLSSVTHSTWSFAS